LRASIALLAFALAALLIWQWWDWPRPLFEPSAQGQASSRAKVPTQSSKDRSELFAPLGEKEEYAAVTERPLFLPNRRPPSEEPEGDTQEELEAPSDLARLDLNAILITPSESSAWIRDPTKKGLVRVRLGDELSGWSVQEIRSDRILLKRQGEKDTLVLRDYKNMPPPTPSKKKRAAPKPRQSPTAAGKPPPSSRRRDRTVRRERNRPEAR